MPESGAFADQNGVAVLRRSAVLFVDILGVRQMATGSDAGKRLADLNAALRRPLGDFLAPSSPWPAAFFSDTLVIVDPVSEVVSPHFALIGLAIQASWIQVNLAAAGFFVRGALTLGDIHLENKLLYGPALVEAYDLERKAAVNPRIILSGAAVKAMTQGMKEDGLSEGGYLRVEQDGRVFIDYLDILLDDPDDPIPFLEDHRDMVRMRLADSRSDSRIWDKYRWVADYHDAYCCSELSSVPQLLIGDDHHERNFKRFEVSGPWARTDPSS